jgi:hypothetical protein
MRVDLTPTSRISSNSLLWSMKSKALRTSRTTILITLQYATLCIKLSMALIVDDRGKPPYWESEISPSVSSYIHRTAKILEPLPGH